MTSHSRTIGLTIALVLTGAAPLAGAATIEYVNGNAVITDSTTPFNPFQVQNNNVNTYTGGVNNAPNAQAVNTTITSPITVSIPTSVTTQGTVGQQPRQTYSPPVYKDTYKNTTVYRDTRTNYSYSSYPRYKDNYYKDTNYYSSRSKTTYVDVPAYRANAADFSPVIVPYYEVQYVAVMPHAGVDTFTGDLDSVSGTLLPITASESSIWSALRLFVSAIGGSVGVMFL